MPEEKAPFFFDTVSISNFALADCLDLIAQRYGKRTLLTSEVMDEIEEGLVQGYTELRRVDGLVQEGRFRTTALSLEERRLYMAMLQNLGSGEASAIACAKHRDRVVVTDDRAARSSCQEHAVRFTGTIGILKACCAASMITPEEADDLLATMVKRGFYSPVRRISEIL